MKNFTQKDRLFAAAKKQAVDKPPCICPGGMMNMISRDIMQKSGCFWPEAHTDPEKMAGLTYALNEAGGFEKYGVPFCMTIEAEALGMDLEHQPRADKIGREMRGFAGQRLAAGLLGDLGQGAPANGVDDHREDEDTP